MYHLLVVDDEARHRRGLIQAIRKIRPDYQIEEAINGEEALLHVERHPAHIILTDIRMPVMDGLFFLEQLRQLAGDATEVIIVTAYRDFNYAQRAIKLHAAEYVLKPVEPDALAEAIMRVESRLADRQQRERERSELADIWETARPVYLERQLSKYLAGGMPRDEWATVQAVARLTGRSGAVAAIRFYGRASERRDDIEACLHRLQRHMEGCGSSYSLLLEGSLREAALVTLFPGDRAVDFAVYVARLRQALAEPHPLVGSDISAAAGVSGPCRDMGEECYAAYKQALAACDERFYDKHTAVFVYSHKQAASPAPAPWMAAAERCAAEIEAAMEAADERQTLDAFNRLADRLRRELVPSAIAKQTLIDAVARLLQRLKALPDTEAARELERPTVSAIKASELFEEARQAAEQAVRKMLHFATGRGANKMERAIAACTAYIDEHYREEFTLEELAERYGFNAFYFSHVFKQTTGCGFSEYVQKRRLHEAKRLLATTENKVYVIAEQVGYRDVKYFNRTFKRKTGMTPEQYRSLHRP